MHVTLHALRKTRSGSAASPIYSLAFLIDGKRRTAHAVVRSRECNAISFREPAIDSLLACNMDQGRRVYQAIARLHRDHVAPALPLHLGNLEPFPATRAHPAQLARAES